MRHFSGSSKKLRFGHEIFGGVLLLRMRHPSPTKIKVLPIQFMEKKGHQDLENQVLEIKKKQDLETQVLEKEQIRENQVLETKENQNLENQVLRKNALEAQVNSNSNNDNDNDNMYTCMYIIVYIYIHILFRYEHLSSSLSLFGTVPLRDTVYGPSSGLFSLLGNLYTAYTALSLMSPTQSLNSDE